MEMTPERWDTTTRYLREVFGAEDPRLRGHAGRAHEAGLPPIAVSADVGHLLHLLTTLACAAGSDDRPRLGIELGTLGGYSGIWIARALAPHGRLITIEPDERHADFARREFDAAGLGDRVEIIRKPALAALPELARRLGPECADLIFLDALKQEYLRYFALGAPLLRPGGLLVADNALGSGSWWIDARAGESPERDGVDRFNRVVASDPGFDCACVPLREGLLIARKKTNRGSAPR